MAGRFFTNINATHLQEVARKLGPNVPMSTAKKIIMSNAMDYMSTDKLDTTDADLAVMRKTLLSLAESTSKDDDTFIADALKLMTELGLEEEDPFKLMLGVSVIEAQDYLARYRYSTANNLQIIATAATLVLGLYDPYKGLLLLAAEVGIPVLFPEETKRVYNKLLEFMDSNLRPVAKVIHNVPRMM